MPVNVGGPLRIGRGPGLGLGLGFGGRARYTPTDAGAIAYIAAMTVQPTDQRKQQINTLFASLRSAGLLSKLSHLWLLAAHDAQAARLNAISPGTNDLSPVNSPAFTTDVGYVGDGATSYLDSGYFFPAGRQNDAHLGIWTRTGAGNNGSDIGNDSSRIQTRSATNVQNYSVNTQTLTGPGTTSDGSGHWVARRGDASTHSMLKDGAAYSTGGAVSAAPTAVAIRVLSRSAASFSLRPAMVAHIGANLTDTEAGNLRNALNVYLQALGAV